MRRLEKCKSEIEKITYCLEHLWRWVFQILGGNSWVFLYSVFGFLWGRREEENDDFDFGKFGDRVEFVEGKGSLKCGWVLIVDKPKTLLG